MKQVSLVVGVETTGDTSVGSFAFAAADATKFDELLARHGFQDTERTLLVDGQATKTAVESKFRRTLKSLAADDTLIFYYAGRTFSAAGENYLASHDTQSDEPIETSLSVTMLLAALRKSPCQNIVLLWDCGESDIAENSTEELAPFDDEEFQTLLEEAPSIVAFVSCSSGQTSHRSKILQHGIWAHHVCEAFAGEASTALKKGLLHAAALQKHLEQSVPRTLAATYTSRKKQTPWSAGNGERVLADVGAIVAEKTAAAGPSDSSVRQVVFMSVKRIDVKQLPGFNKKTHRVPDAINRYNETFVANLAQGEIKEDLDTIYARLKKFYAFARADLAVAEPGDGTGSIVTPYFNYSIGVSLNPENPAESIWTRSVDSIKVPERIFGDEFEDVFGDRFETLRYTLPGKIDLEAFIDFVESQKSSELKLEYDRELTYCELQIPGVEARVRITPRAVSIGQKSAASPRVLIKAFQQVKTLLDGKDVRGIAYDGEK